MPDFVRPVAEPLSAMVEAIVRPPKALVLFWITTRSAPAAPTSVPPVIEVALLPTALVSRMPPEESVSVLPVATLSVVAAAVLNRRLLTD